MDTDTDKIVDGENAPGVEVSPWAVTTDSETGVDYDKLVDQFGCEKISPELLVRFEQVTGRKCHPLMRRGLFFAHRDLETILAAKEKGLPIYLYTGRGPSSETLHLGHLVPFIFTKWLQDALDCLLVIQMTDDEKFLFKPKLTLEECKKCTIENAKDILAVGFDPKKTFIFSDLDYIHELYPMVLEIQKKITINQAKGIFGFNDSDNIGKIAFPAVEAAPCFSSIFPDFIKTPGNKPALCLIPSAIDQDPFFRMTRDLAPRLNLPKPSCIYAKFIPALQGARTKMSSSVENAILLTDTPKMVQKKINKYAFSGGGATLEEHKANGADLSVDVPFMYLNFFLEDDEELAKIGTEYSSGRMLTSEIKTRLGSEINKVFAELQERRKNITPEIIAEAMNPVKRI